MFRIKKLLIIIDKTFGYVESTVLVLLLLTIISLQGYQIVLRQFFSQNIEWIGPFMRSCILWLAIVGGTKAVSTQKNIKIDIAQKIFSNSTLKKLNNFLCIICSLVCFLLAIISYYFVIEEKNFGEIVFLNIPVWQIELIFPIGFSLMTIHFLCRPFTNNQEHQ